MVLLTKDFNEDVVAFRNDGWQKLSSIQSDEVDAKNKLESAIETK
jgi:hypothetical protein